MGCLSLGLIEHLLIWLIVIGAVFAIIKLLLPPIIAPLGAIGATVASIITIILYAIILIAVVYLVFGLLSCIVPIR